jgi:hypothetical protein
MNKYFNQMCIDKPEEARAEGIILRDPMAWYFKSNSFFKKEVTNFSVLAYLSAF